jgi:hypothetical protein
MRMKPKWRGSVIAVASLLAFCAVFYGSEEKGSGAAKTWLFIFFATGFFGGALAFVDSIRQIAAARRQQAMGKRSDEKSDAAK